MMFRQPLASVDLYVDADTPIHIQGPRPGYEHSGVLHVGDNWQVSVHAATLGVGDTAELRPGVDKLKDIHAWFAYVTAELATSILEAGGTVGGDPQPAESFA